MRIILLCVFAGVILAAGCFLPWMTVESKNITITGLQTAGTSFGKPAYLHFCWAGLCIIFIAINRSWARKAALVVTAFNVAWAVRNFFLIPACQMGDCPVRNTGLYVVFIASLLLFLFVFLLNSAPAVKRR